MKKVYIVILIFCLGAAMVFSQNSDVEILDSVTIESFDNESTGWTVSASRYVDNQILSSRIVEAWPNQLFGYAPDSVRRALGVRASFQQRGNNYIEIIPPGEALELRGLVKEIELWVWNAQRNYSVTAQLQDYLGIYYTLEFGDINHGGWRKLSARIPNYILQLDPKLHQDNNRLRLIKFIVWTDPSERVDDFQLYFDEIRVLSDVFQPRIDGENLLDAEFIRRTWGDV